MGADQKLLYQIALTQINGVGDKTARNLLTKLATPEAIFQSSRKDLLSVQGLGHKSINEILHPDVMRKAEKELAFVKKNNLKTYFINDSDYPSRMHDCEDAPILFYFKGDTNLSAKKIISIVGTRTASKYGSDFCDSFLEDIANMHPDCLIISGLAYGIDVSAHRAALKHNLPTVGVLAHGLDRIYPAEHRQTAVDMLEKGGLLTEFSSGTKPDKFNFVRRNRIVAAMADAVIVVESNERGGSLITAEIANSYCKDVFAVPGRTNDKRSEGCNKLIAQHKADLLLSTQYFLEQMHWDEESEKDRNRPKQRELFLELNEEEQKVVDILTTHESLYVDALATQSEIPSYLLSSILLELEMKGVINNLPGNLYELS